MAHVCGRYPLVCLTPSLLNLPTRNSYYFLAMSQRTRDLAEIWIQHQRRNYKTSLSYACIYCSDRQTFKSSDNLLNHALVRHKDELPADGSDTEQLHTYSLGYEAESRQQMRSL